MSLNVIFYFLPVTIILLVSSILLFYFKHKYVRESGEGAGPPEQAEVPAFVAPAGVSKWVTTPRLLCMHYYFNSMYTLFRETAQHYFPTPALLAGPTETIQLGVVQLRAFICCIFFSVCFSKFPVNVKKYFDYISICHCFISVVFFLIFVNSFKISCMCLLHLFALSNKKKLSMLINLDYSGIRNETVEGNAYAAGSTWRWKGIQRSICIDSINLSSS